MAADPSSRGTSILLTVLVLATGYVAWQVAPLSRRMDALERDRLETRDQMQRQIETLRQDLERLRPVAPPPSALPAPASTAREKVGAARGPSAVPGEPVAPPAKPAVGHVNAETFFASRLLPEDAAIATLLVDQVPVAEIARRLKHTTAFIVAKGIQIEKQLAAVPSTPAEILSGLRAAVEQAKAAR